MHEDLNVAPMAGRSAELSMPSEKQLLRYSDDQIEKTYSEAFSKCNQSIIVDLMFGQTVSSI